MATHHQWILLCGLLVQVANAGDARIESLIAINQKVDGVELSAFPKYFGIQGPASEPTDTKMVSGRQLSSDCGDQYFRCKPLQAVVTQNTSNQTAYQLFIPLNGGLLIVELNLQSANNSKMVFGSQYRILDTHDCSPTAIFKIYDSHYTMCTDLQNKLVSLYEIRVNKSSISQTEIIGPLVNVEQLADFTDASDVMNMSNFLVSTDDPHIPYIYFAVDYYLFAIAPLDLSVSFDRLGTMRCRYIHRLEHVSSSQILAYCSSEFIYYDTEQGNWVSEHSYTDSGVPYLCPNEMYGVSAFQNYLEYFIDRRKGTLSRVSVDSGFCFGGKGGQNFFVYNDKVADTTTLMNLSSSGKKIQLCENLDCLPAIAVEDPVRYLIVRRPSGDGQISVLDVEENFTMIISANIHDSEASDMFTIVHVKAPLYPSPSGLPPIEKTQMFIHIIVGVLCALVAVAVTTVAIIFVIFLSCKINKWITRQGRCTGIITEEIAATVPLPESQPACILSNHHIIAFEAPHGQPLYWEQAVPSPVSLSGDAANSMQAGGNSNSCLRQLGEEEEKLQQEKVDVSEDHNIDNGNLKIVGPAVTLHDSSSLATAAAPLSLDPVTNLKSADTVCGVSGHTATNAADSDTGSEDSRMNSDREALLDNSCSY